jgi:hypothetical protein
MPFCSACGKRARLDVVVVDQLRCFFVRQVLQRFGNLHLLELAPAAAHLLEHPLDLRREVFHSGGRHDLHLRRGDGHFDFDVLVVEAPFAEHLAEFLPRRRIGGLHVVEVHFARRRQQHVEHAFLGRVRRAIANHPRLGLARLLHRHFDEVAHDRVHVAADVADLGELRRLPP